MNCNIGQYLQSVCFSYFFLFICTCVICEDVLHRLPNNFRKFFVWFLHLHRCMGGIRCRALYPLKGWIARVGVKSGRHLERGGKGSPFFADFSKSWPSHFWIPISNGLVQFSKQALMDWIETQQELMLRNTEGGGSEFDFDPSLCTSQPNIACCQQCW